jgi:hypothetical protein
MDRKPTPSAFQSLASELEVLFTREGDQDWPAAKFEKIAGRVLEHQFRQNAPYRALCERRGFTPGGSATWTAAPLVPAMAFKHLDLRSFDDAAEAEFRTSGTSAGPERRGVHTVPRLALYRAACLGPFRRNLLPDRARIRFLSLVPPAEEAPHSSLSHMITIATRELATQTHWLVDAEGRLAVDELERAAADTVERGEPVLVVGTALALLHALERVPGRGRLQLAPGSRVMETGGFKGVTRAVTRAELYGRLTDATGVDEERIVSEYGMTELLSQLYERILTEGAVARGAHRPPPWLRVRALDPATLAPLEEGHEGVLAFFDLANLGSISAVLTQDIGSVEGGRVRLRGRARGADERGCSRAMDELMAAVP